MNAAVLRRLSFAVPQIDSQNTLLLVLTEIKPHLCERAASFPFTEMRSDLRFIPLNKSPVTQYNVLEIRRALKKKKKKRISTLLF